VVWCGVVDERGRLLLVVMMMMHIQGVGFDAHFLRSPSPFHAYVVCVCVCVYVCVILTSRHNTQCLAAGGMP
jgi:hypothetical protein